MRPVVLVPVLVLVLAAGCSKDMRGAALSPTWTRAAALAKAREAIAVARTRLGGAPLRRIADLDPEDTATLAKATVRRESFGWPAPGPGFALPFIFCARGRIREGGIGIASGGFAIGLAVDLLVFAPFGYSHRGVFVEVQDFESDEGGNGFYAAREGWRVLFFDMDDRMLWRDNRMDDVAEAFEFLARDARARAPARGASGPSAGRSE